VIDGENILPLLRGQAGSPHEFLYYFKGKRLYGIRLGKWKYLRAHMTDNGGYAALRQGPFLFNLETDPQESYNLIDSHPEVAQALADMLDQFDAELKANIRGWKE
jgi:arylsulfatase A-like enzyme